MLNCGIYPSVGGGGGAGAASREQSLSQSPNSRKHRAPSLAAQAEFAATAKCVRAFADTQKNGREGLKRG